MFFCIVIALWLSYNVIIDFFFFQVFGCGGTCRSYNCIGGGGTCIFYNCISDGGGVYSSSVRWSVLPTQVRLAGKSIKLVKVNLAQHENGCSGENEMKHSIGHRVKLHPPY